jgi:hypothetical protein
LARSSCIVRPVFEGLGQRHLAQLQLHPARLDFREVEHVVDQGEQMTRSQQNVVQVIELTRVQLPEHLLA